jgi:hypothetical protein
MAKRVISLIVSHALAVGFGFAAGIYFLPILIAPDAPDQEQVIEAFESSDYVGTFSRDRIDSDSFHWGEGEFSLSTNTAVFSGTLAPGPDYRLYLSPEFVETEADFNRLRSVMVQLGPIRTFENFIVEIPSGVEPSDYSTAIVWCETFGEYITSGTYERKK